MIVVYVLIVFFFFKQKTEYGMRISDWSSYVCSSDLKRAAFEAKEIVQAVRLLGLLDQPRLQNFFIARLRQDARELDDYRLIVELANESGRADLALRTAKSARRDGHDLHPLLYPRRALPQIGRAHV